MIGGKVGQIIHEPGLRMGFPWQYERQDEGARLDWLIKKTVIVCGVPYPEGFPLQHEPRICFDAGWKDNAQDENGG